MVVLGLFHLALMIVALAKEVVNHQFGLDIFGLPRVLEVLFQYDDGLVVELKVHNHESQTH